MLQIYGISACGTCKKALQWLTAQGIEYEFIDTREQPPTPAMIQDWMQTLGSKPMRNTSGQSYRSLSSDKQTWTDDQWSQAFAQDAMLLKRPLFVQNGKAITVGFKKETIGELLK